jgi:hypothetical protein
MDMLPYAMEAQTHAPASLRTDPLLISKESKKRSLSGLF